MEQFSYFEWDSINNWYIQHWRLFLPWRDYKLTQKELLYRVWLSEILLQQTQAERVVWFYEKILKKFPTIESLAQSNYEEFFPYYKGLWYYSRAKNLLKTAQIVTREYNWIFPENKEILKKLPGIWDYTSSAIIAFWYGNPTLAFDTNLEKIFSRYYFWTSQQKLSPHEKDKILKNFQKFITWHNSQEQKSIVRNINNWLMDFARMIDSINPEKINWNEYPIKSWKFYNQKWRSEVINKKKNDTFPIPDAKILAILHENHKIYFSENHAQYNPFILQPSLSRNTREFVKKFFLEKYSIEVSVRPVHKKFFKNDEPFIAVNVQIQTGNNPFFYFSKQEARHILQSIFDK